MSPTELKRAVNRPVAGRNDERKQERRKENKRERERERERERKRERQKRDGVEGWD
jgi:ribosomal protein L12E/L44/L45/RPP1/RPP2